MATRGSTSEKGECIDGEKGLTYEGLLRTYDNGIGDVDHDFNVLGLKLNSNDAKNKEVRSGLDKVSSSIADERAMEMQKKQRRATWAGVA
ncbi:hypothetical protein NL676_009380 [Syzygium grande]|nr:hypothetical protein NL676_009380 [Syzygium grande]